VPAIVVRNLSPETHRALRQRARKHGRSTEAEIRVILDRAVGAPGRRKLGSALAALAKPFRGIDLKVERDKTPARPARLR
jgi:plasmid stability protein